MDRTTTRGRRDMRARKDLRRTTRPDRTPPRPARNSSERLKKAIEDYTRMMNALCA